MLGLETKVENFREDIISDIEVENFREDYNFGHRSRKLIQNKEVDLVKSV